MEQHRFVPHHMNASAEDFVGNGDWGRYVLLPGSDGRAAKLASQWSSVRERRHPRAHNLYTGVWASPSGPIDMAAISTGMGAASADIILNELLLLNASNLVRIGTAGSLQPETLKVGAIVVPTGAVRDESTSARYLPPEVPAVPSHEFLLASAEVATSPQGDSPVHFGLCHSKDSLFAREFHIGPQRQENLRYMQVLREGGVLASEMESSILFTLGQVFRQRALTSGGRPVLTGSVLAIIGDDSPFGDMSREERAVDAAIHYALRVIEAIHRRRTGVGR